MLKNFIIMVLCGSMLTISCNKKENTVVADGTTEKVSANDRLNNDRDSTAKSTGIFQSFDLPGELSGCNSKFAASKEDFDQEKFIYADDYGNMAYIMINGKMIKIPMEEGEFDPAEIDRSIEDDLYKVTLTGKKLQQQGETATFEGKIRIQKKDGSESMSSIYGQTGC